MTLAGAAPTAVRRYSDLLGATTIQMFRGIFFDTNLQYNQDIDRVMRSTVAFSWKPEANKVINLGYRYYRADTNTGQLPLEQADISAKFASRRDDKFEGVAVTRGELGVPLIANALTTLECALRESLPGGDHTIFVGEVVDAQTRDGVPLLYFRSGYREMRS